MFRRQLLSVGFIGLMAGCTAGTERKEESGTVGSGEYVSYPVDIESKADLEVSLSVEGESMFLVMSENEFNRLRDGKSFAAQYENADLQGDDEVSVELTPGSYHVVILNESDDGIAYEIEIEIK